MQRTIIALAGQMGAGKDSLAAALKKQLQSKNRYLLTLSFAQALKTELDLLISNLFDYRQLKTNKQAKFFDYLEVTFHANAGQLKTVQTIIDPLWQQLPRSEINAHLRHPAMRRLLQYWGTTVRRQQDPDYWIKQLDQTINSLADDRVVLTITDARFTNELNYAKRIGAKLIYLDISTNERIRRIKQRDGFLPSQKALEHRSEQDMINYSHYDLILSDDHESSFKQAQKVVELIEKP